MFVLYNGISDPLCILELKCSWNQGTQIDNSLFFPLKPDIYLFVKLNLCINMGAYGIAMCYVHVIFIHVYA